MALPARSSDHPGELTLLLHRWSEGDSEALSLVAERIYPELRRIARAQLARERKGHSYSSRALVNEAFLKLMELNRIDIQDRHHLLALVTLFMRRLLVEHARARKGPKRGGGAVHVSLHDHDRFAAAPSVDILDLHQALERLEKEYPREAKVAELHGFGGLRLDEIASRLGVHESTVGRDWRFASAWLRKELAHPGDRS